MKKKVSYGIKLKNIPMASHRVIEKTISIYNEACEYIANVVCAEWSQVSIETTLKYREHVVENLIHATKKNPSPKYKDFDTKFYKFPSYLRRNAIDAAIGSVSSYMSNLKNYENDRYYKISNGMKFKKKRPDFNPKLNKYPTLFKDNMFNRLDRNTVEIKLFKNNDWVWVKCGLRNQDVKYIENTCVNMKELAPTLEKSGMGYKLRFTYEKKVDFKRVSSICDRKILSVDLGVNTSAVCSVVNGNGTVLGRKFVDMPREKDLMYRLINRVSKLQRQSGLKAKLKKIWIKIANLKKEITNKVSHKILSFAMEQNVEVIVFERLGVMKLRGYGAKKNRRKIQNWNKKTIIKKVCAKAHTVGIRYSVVNPRNTSALAFDGSGKVVRDKNNASLCTFTTGKRYNADLNASYNIAARYFIREFQKSASESKWSKVLAKVPELSSRINTTLASLINLAKVFRTA